MNLINTATMIFAQQGGGNAYMIGQILGVIFLVVLVGAVVRSILMKKK